MKRFIFVVCALVGYTTGSSQTCNCEKEFRYIVNHIEQNYAGFTDKLKEISKKLYEKKTNELLNAAKVSFDDEACVYVIKQYLDQFRDRHIQFRMVRDTTPRQKREIYNLDDEKIKQLEAQTSGWEGIYYFRHDSSYKIAVIKDPNPIHDYIGVIVDSKLPNWKRGMIKWEGRQTSDSMIFGILYQRIYGFSFEGLNLADNRIGGDWVRAGAPKYERPPLTAANRVELQGSKRITDKTFFIKINSFDPANAKSIDSIFKANDQVLSTTPNLILDLRGNGGGSDFSYEPIIKYIYSTPVKTIGLDVLATEINIAGWKKILDNRDIPKENKDRINAMIAMMENNKGKFVNISEDEIDSAYTPRAFPKKVAILINGGCASTTEQFLLTARQSSKVILLGQNTQGTLDYSNMREIPFSCLPGKLFYATTRSRRLDVGQGIDNVGIAPNHYLKSDADWIAEAVKILEQ